MMSVKNKKYSLVEKLEKAEYVSTLIVDDVRKSYTGSTEIHFYEGNILYLIDHRKRKVDIE